MSVLSHLGSEWVGLGVRLSWSIHSVIVLNGHIRACIRRVNDNPAAFQFQGKPEGLAIFVKCCLLSAVPLSWLTLWFEENKIVIDCKIQFFSCCDKSSVYWETGQSSRKPWHGCRDIIHYDVCVDFLLPVHRANQVIDRYCCFSDSIKGQKSEISSLSFDKQPPKRTPPPTVTWLLVIKQRIVFIECFVPFSVSLQEMLNVWNLLIFRYNTQVHILVSGP